jgi:hypothetical protein
MSKLTVEVTAPLAEFIAIVDELGYQTFVGTIDSETGIPTTIPNPETQQAFLERYVKTLIVNDFTRAKVKAIENAVRDERTAEKEALKTAIGNAVNVTFTV